MPFWVVALLLLGATFAANYLLARRSKQETRKPATLGEFNFPTATEARPVPVIVGTVVNKAPNCTWYGDLQTLPIKKKVPNPLTFGITKKTVETGQYRYFVGMQLDLGQGAGGVKLKEFRVDDKVCWTGNLASGTFSFDKSNLFGGEEKEGGYAGTFHYYAGSWTQNYDTYVQGQRAGMVQSHKRGKTYLVQLGPSSGNIAAKTPNGYIGVAPNLKPYSFVLERFPNFLGQPATVVVNGDDANPLEWAYEVLTNTEYGAGIPPSEINLAKFKAAATTCFNEGIGLSILWDSQRNLDDVLNDIGELIDGAFFVDRTTGKWTVELARADYDVDTLPVFDESVLEEIDFGANSPKGAPSEIVVNFVDKNKNFTTRPTTFRDLALRRQQSVPNQQTIEFYGVCNAELAAKLCFREARVNASDLRKVTFKNDRTAHLIRPFSVFIYVHRDFEILEGGEQNRYGEPVPVVMRAMRVDDGNFADGEIEIEAVEDVFSLGEVFYTPPSGGGGETIQGDAVAVTLAFLGEQPFFISAANSAVWAFAAKPNGAQINFDLFAKLNSESEFALRSSGDDFAPTGTLISSYGKTAAVDAGSTLILENMSGGVRLDNASASEIANEGTNLFMFADTGEICAAETIVLNSNGTVTLSNVWRGLLDTAVETHSPGARVWFFSYGQSTPETTFAQGATVNVKPRPNSLRGSLELSAATTLSVTISARAARPLPPGNVTLNGTLFNSVLPSVGANISFAWFNRNRLSQETVVKQNAANITGESGQSVTVKIFKGSDGTLLKTYSGLTGTNWDYTAAMQLADGANSETALSFLVYSERAGISSFQANKFAAARADATVPAFPVYVPTGTYVAPPSDTATSIGGIPIIGNPSSTHTQLQYDPATNTFVWVTAGTGSLTFEQIQDMLSAFLIGEGGVETSYDDAANLLKIRLVGLTTSGGELIVEDCNILCDDLGNNDVLLDS